MNVARKPYGLKNSRLILAALVLVSVASCDVRQNTSLKVGQSVVIRPMLLDQGQESASKKVLKNVLLSVGIVGAESAPLPEGSELLIYDSAGQSIEYRFFVEELRGMPASSKCSMDLLSLLTSKNSGENFLVCGGRIDTSKIGHFELRIPDKKVLVATGFSEVPMPNVGVSNIVVSFSR